MVLSTTYVLYDSLLLDQVQLNYMSGSHVYRISEAMGNFVDIITVELKTIYSNNKKCSIV